MDYRYIYTEMQHRTNRRYRRESLIDPWMDTLDPAVWDLSGELPMLNYEVRQSIIDTINKHFSQWDDSLQAVILTGSITSEFYTDKADIDIGLYYDVNENELEQIVDIVGVVNNDEVSYFNEHPIQFHIDPTSDLERIVNGSDAAYNVTEDVWLKVPIKQEKNIETLNDLLEAIRSRADEIAKKLDLNMGEIIRDLQDIERYMQGSKTGKVKQAKMLENRLNDLENEINDYTGTLDDIHQKRARAFADNLEDTDAAGLIEKYKTNTVLPSNLVFKYLQKWSYYQLQQKFKKIMKDGEITEDEIKELEKAIISVYSDIFEVK